MTCDLKYDKHVGNTFWVTMKKKALTDQTETCAKLLTADMVYFPKYSNVLQHRHNKLPD